MPLGASSLRSWCSSRISTSGIQAAAISAKRIISTAPTLKLGTTRTPRPADALARAIRSRSSVPRPVVPITTPAPRASAASAWSAAARGWLRSMSTSKGVSSSAGRSGRSGPPSSRALRPASLRAVASTRSNPWAGVERPERLPAHPPARPRQRHP